MNQPGIKRLNVWMPLLFALIMILGMVLGFNLRDSLRNKRDILTIIERNDRLEQLIDLINERYVDSLEVNNLYRDAVSGILSHLDPHTIYIPADELQAVNEDMEGRFFGIGVEFSIMNDTVRVTSVIPGGPAAKAGVAMGAGIVQVNDSLVAGMEITSDRIIQMLRGPKNSSVNVLLSDPVTRSLQSVDILRDEIPLVSVDANVLLDSVTAYIRINRFSATTYQEFSQALQTLSDKGARQLILDLRQNPGGYLDAATKIADDFLDGEKLITYTEGRRSAKKTYTAGETQKFEQGRLVVLVDENSASASEIIAGAVQDWDRGLIVGRRTYGKGLVQEQYELGDGSALRLTIARYYTPSGRSIQRSYAAGKDAYREDISRRYQSGELTGTDTSFSALDTVRYFTRDKRVVYGGGGITPDIFVPYDTAGRSVALYEFLSGKALEAAVWNYFFDHREDLQGMENVETFIQKFQGTDVLKYLHSQLPDSLGKQLQKLQLHPRTRSYLLLHVKARLARMLFRNEGYYTVLAKEDPDIRKAVQSLEKEMYRSLLIRR